MIAAQDFGDYYRISPDFRDLNYDRYVENGEKKISLAADYNSHNSEQLSVVDMQNLLIKLDDFQEVNEGTKEKAAH